MYFCFSSPGLYAIVVLYFISTYGVSLKIHGYFTLNIQVIGNWWVFSCILSISVVFHFLLSASFWNFPSDEKTCNGVCQFVCVCVCIHTYIYIYIYTHTESIYIYLYIFFTNYHFPLSNGNLWKTVLLSIKIGNDWVKCN